MEVLGRNPGCQASPMRGLTRPYSLGYPPAGTPVSPGNTRPAGAFGYTVLWWPGHQSAVRPDGVGLGALQGSYRTPSSKVRFGFKRIVSSANPTNSGEEYTLYSPPPCSKFPRSPSRKSEKKLPVTDPLKLTSGSASQDACSRDYSSMTLTPATTMCFPLVQATWSPMFQSWRFWMTFCSNQEKPVLPQLTRTVALCGSGCGMLAPNSFQPLGMPLRDSLVRWS